ncbi:unnamed protein product [Cyprideis torosa]|uniref:Uncharacterized protein n=1 Tax=Cyprideis torosa TaxID=163714 RepID=A0A7R8ZVS0_9CRUS|nr:unnamed protein product [Cyprideis torosa]CAG0903912.1 unnamed protein product [Cyprideis torosa]
MFRIVLSRPWIWPALADKLPYFGGPDNSSSVNQPIDAQSIIYFLVDALPVRFLRLFPLLDLPARHSGLLPIGIGEYGARLYSYYSRYGDRFPRRYLIKGLIYPNTSAAAGSKGKDSFSEQEFRETITQLEKDEADRHARYAAQSNPFALSVLSYTPPSFQLQANAPDATFRPDDIADHVGRKLGTMSKTDEVTLTHFGPLTVREALPKEDWTADWIARNLPVVTELLAGGAGGKDGQGRIRDPAEQRPTAAAPPSMASRFPLIFPIVFPFPFGGGGGHHGSCPPPPQMKPGEGGTPGGDPGAAGPGEFAKLIADSQ